MKLLFSAYLNNEIAKGAIFDANTKEEQSYKQIIDTLLYSDEIWRIKNFQIYTLNNPLIPSAI